MVWAWLWPSSTSQLLGLLQTSRSTPCLINLPDSLQLRRKHDSSGFRGRTECSLPFTSGINGPGDLSGRTRIQGRIVCSVPAQVNAWALFEYCTRLLIPWDATSDTG